MVSGTFGPAPYHVPDGREPPVAGGVGRVRGSAVGYDERVGAPLSRVALLRRRTDVVADGAPALSPLRYLRQRQVAVSVDVLPTASVATNSCSTSTSEAMSPSQGWNQS